jgi:MinD superfamily P-loop ATPase
MKEIVVLSGKGGTGKTSVAAALAVLALNDTVIADCDVDAANLHLLLTPDYHRSIDFYGGNLAEISPDECTNCGLCAGKCRFDAIVPGNGSYYVNPLDCEGCGYCAVICPQKAIRLTVRNSGSLYISRTRIGATLVHARLFPGAENSGKLVARVKEEARIQAKTNGKSFILVDGSPGIGCPVISSLAGANYVLLVTEPTISGLHDLRRIYDLIRRFRIPAGCVINKYDLNTDVTRQIKQELKALNICHLADIPYDTSFVTSMIDGKTVVESDSVIGQQIRELWTNIQKILKNSDTI